MPLIDLAEYTQPLSRTPSVLRAVLADVPEEWLDRRHAPDVVSPRETVAHLLICEAEESWIFRLRFLLDPKTPLEHGRFAHQTDAQLAANYSLGELLDAFEAHRKQNLLDLAGLGLAEDHLEVDLSEEGFGTQTVGNLLNTWVAHDLYHLGQVFKSFSAPYADKIGPYQKYLNLPHFN